MNIHVARVHDHRCTCCDLNSEPVRPADSRDRGPLPAAKSKLDLNEFAAAQLARAPGRCEVSAQLAWECGSASELDESSPVS